MSAARGVSGAIAALACAKGGIGGGLSHAQIDQLIAAVVLTSLSIVTFGSGNAAASVLGPNCTGFYSNSTWNSVVVPSHSSCTIAASTINGSVLVNPGASFTSCDNHITGSISANSAYLNIDHDTWVGGSISTINPVASESMVEICETTVAVAQPNEVTGSLICPYHVGGSISEQNLSRNNPPVLIGNCFATIIIVNPGITPADGPGTWVGGSVLMAGNHNHVTLVDSYVVGNVTCANDNPNSVTSAVDANRIVGCVQEIPET
jgi:hypothetical protein